MADNRSIHSQTDLLLFEQYHKHESFDLFLNEISSNTLKGLGIGFTFGLLFRKKFSMASLGAGVGGGISINKCADEFNRI